MEEGSPGDGLISQLVRLRTAAGADEAAIDRVYERALELHPNLHRVRLELAMRAMSAGDVERAEGYFPLDGGALMEDIGYRMSAISFWQQNGRNDVAMPLLDGTIEMAAADRRFAAGWLVDLSGAAMRMGEQDLSLELIERAAESEGVHPGVYFAAAEVAATFGDSGGAVDWIERGRAAVEKSTQPFEKAQLGQVMVRAGMGMRFDPLIEAGVGAMRDAAEGSGEPLIWHDMAPVLYQVGRTEEAADAIVRAAELAPESAVLAGRASELCAMVGEAERAAEWTAEAERRSGGG